MALGGIEFWLDSLLSRGNSMTSVLNSVSSDSAILPKK